MAYLDELIGRAAPGTAFPWAVADLERPELAEVARALVEHGLLATAAARELRLRGWVADGGMVEVLATAVHQRLVNRQRYVGPYAPRAAEPVGPCDPATREGERRLAAHLSAEADAAPPDPSAATCAACAAASAPEAPLSTHFEPGGRRVALCPACHHLAHTRTPPLATVEVRWLRERPGR